ncbi:MAG: hypothetical protein CVU66_00150 [Deltaproteobacteria bacterium HGW-Deltaproteobacteria-23]|nr:MAG: hypothetical protein CVU66_00150 [Deltaproteobacteria bacterium HGW-Deltaproteobacteria-23]
MQVYLLFTISGATALIYQIIWARWLGLIFGNTTISVSLILASFMLGLALGSWGIGRRLHSIKNPLSAYAFIEFGIGLFAIIFPYLTKLAEIIFAATVTAESPQLLSIFVRALLAFLLLLLPTTLMGATLPLLTDFFKRSHNHSKSWKVGILYAANTLGAAFGIVIAGFLLIELVGVANTTIIAAVLNFLIAAFALKMATTAQLTEPAKVAEIKSVDRKGALAFSILTISGATALASEVLWTRTIESIIGNSTYAFSTIVLVYLIGIAFGSWLIALNVNRFRNPSFWLASCQISMGVWIFIAILLLKIMAAALDPVKGTEIPFPLLLSIYVRVMLVLFPLAFFSGACFPLATRIIDSDSEEAEGGLIARAYSLNTLGAVVGSLLAGFLIAPHFDYLNALYLLAFIYTLTAAVAYLLISKWEPEFRRKLTGMTIAAPVTVIMLFISFTAPCRNSSFADHIAAANPALQIVSHKKGLQGITTILKERDKPLADRLLVNGMGMTVKVTDTKMMAHLPLLLHKNPQDTLIICFGMGTTFRSAITHGNNVTAVELVKEVMDGFDYFHGNAPRARQYEKGRMVVNDGRNFLKLTKNSYDVITIDPPPPIDAAGVNHLHSKEFLQLARSRLKKGGLMAHWIPFPGTQGGVDDYVTFNMLLETFAEVFPYTYTQRGFHDVGLHLIGALEPLDISTARLEMRLDNQQIIDDILEWDQVPINFFEGVREYQRPHKGIALVTDDRPVLEFYLLRTLLSGGEKTLIYNYW